MKTKEIFYRWNLKRLHDIVGNEPIVVNEKFNPKNEVYSKPINSNKSGCQLPQGVGCELRHNHFLTLN